MAAGTIGAYGGASDFNRVATPAVLAAESLMRLNDHLFLVKLLNRVYQKYFADQIGDTISYKLPYYPIVGDGRTIDFNNANAFNDEWRTLTVDTWKNVPFKFNSDELTHGITDMARRYLDPGMEELAHAYDEDAGKVLAEKTFRRDGTAGTALNLATAQDVAAHARMVSIPMNEDRFAIMDPYDIAALGKEVQNLNANDKLVGMAIEDRYRTTLAGFKIYESDNIPPMETGLAAASADSPVTNKAGGIIGSEVPFDGAGPSSSNQLFMKKGEMFTIAGVYESTMRGERKSTGNLMTFTCTEDVTRASGAGTIKITPPINDGTLTVNGKAYPGGQNVVSKAADNVAINRLGTRGKKYRQSIWGNRNVATCANVMILPPPSAERSGNAGYIVDPMTGLGITVTRFYKGETMEEFHRFDSKWGVDICYPEMGIRCLSSEING